jgi:hypothetical protein
MKLSEIFNQLAYGELSQSSVVDVATGGIAATKYGQLIAHVNLGLSALFKRFPLKEKTVTFTLKSGQLIYPISVADSDIIDAEEGAEDFSDDILKIESIHVSSGVELGLNNKADPLSCFTPKVNVLSVPTLIVEKSLDLPSYLLTDTLKLTYRADHAILKMVLGLDPTKIEIDLPYSYLELLLLFIASRVTTPLGAGQFEGLAGNNYYAKYEQACQALEMANLRVDQGSQNTRLTAGGWP